MSIHERLQAQLFQNGLDASKQPFSFDEFRRTLDKTVNSVTAPIQSEPVQARFTGTEQSAGQAATYRATPERQNILLEENVVATINQFREHFGRELSYGWDVSQLIKVAASYDSLTVLGMSKDGNESVLTALDACASRLEVMRLISESKFAASDLKPAFDEGFRLTFNYERPVDEQLIKAVPGREGEYWILTARGGLNNPFETDEKKWRVGTLSHPGGNWRLILSDEEVTLQVALSEYANLAPNAPDESTSLSM